MENRSDDNDSPDEGNVEHEEDGRGGGASEREPEPEPDATDEPVERTAEPGEPDARTGEGPRPTLEVVDANAEPLRVCPPSAGCTVVLVGGGDTLRQEVEEALGEGFAVLHSDRTDAGLEMVRRCSPDIVLLDRVAAEPRVLGAFRADPLTDFVPVLVVGTEPDLDARAEFLRAGATDFLPRPFEAGDLRERIRTAVDQPVLGGGGIHGNLGDATLPELVGFVTREIRRGVLDAAGPGADSLRVEIGRGGELMAALWAFVARLRDVVDRGAPGKVVFRSLEPGRVDVMALSAGRDATEEIKDEDVISETIAGLDHLGGLRVVVADDDPAIRWAFTTALGEVGMDVEAVANGRSALRAIRADRPDLLITDILMPEMDGWELLRRLRRDLLLRDLPVVVLSWKEDFLQRMKELAADADEYMLKETDRSQILLGVSRVLAAKRQLERRIAGEGQVAGRVDSSGIVPLLRAVAQVRRDARLVVRETWNLFEVDIRDGRIVSSSNTTAGGSYLTGSRALGLLLGVEAGRYGIEPLPEKISQNVEGDIDEALARAARPVQEMVEMVSGGAIVKVARVGLRAEVVGEYAQVAPGGVRGVLARLADGESPRDLILSGTLGPQELESTVLDLIRRGVVERVEAPLPVERVGPVGEDEERWAVIGGEVPPPTRSSSYDGERVSIPTPLPAGPPPIPLPSPEDEALSSRDAPASPPRDAPRSRTWIYLALVALAAILIARLGGRERNEEEPREQDRPTASATVAGGGASEGEDEELPSRGRVTVLEDISVQVGEGDAGGARGASADAAGSAADVEQDRAGQAHDAEAPPARGDGSGARREAGEGGAPSSRPRSAPSTPSSETRSAVERSSSGPATPDGPAPLASGETGTLRILAPEAGSGPVEVWIDGERQGEAPLTVRLAPGMHGVQFRAGEARSFAAVQVNAGETVTRTPRMAR